jgi:hypothetical protein
MINQEISLVKKRMPSRRIDDFTIVHINNQKIKGKIFFNKTASKIWAFLDEPRTPRWLINQISKDSNASKSLTDVISLDVERFIRNLLKVEMLERIDAPSTDCHVNAEKKTYRLTTMIQS